jgi:hypothetical protein
MSTSTHSQKSVRSGRQTGSEKSSFVRGGRELIRRLRSVDSETLLSYFSERQYIKPRQSVADLLREAQDHLGICPVAAGRAVEWLDVDPELSVGRLRRTELIQLARCLHRFHRHASQTDCRRNIE